jgi:hypothetical protein
LNRVEFKCKVWRHTMWYSITTARHPGGGSWVARYGVAVDTLR